MRRRLLSILTILSSMLLFSSLAQAMSSPTLTEINIRVKEFEFHPNIIEIIKDKPVRLIISSQDRDFDLIVPELDINSRIVAGKTVAVEFTASRTGRFAVVCRAFDDREINAGEMIVREPNVDYVSASGVRVSFDRTNPAVIVVESGTEVLRIDTAARKVETVPVPSEESAGNAQSKPPEKKPQERESSKTYEPYDYHVVNIPTPKQVRSNSLNLYFTHRFQEPITPFESEDASEHIARISKDLFGLDSSAVSSFGFSYGITGRLYANVYRSSLCQQGLCKTIEMGLGYHLLDEAGKSPIALSAYASVEGDYNFTERYTWNFQAMLARSITKYVNVFFSPAAHVNSNGGDRFKEFLESQPLAANLRLGRHSGSFGFGVNARIRPTTSLLFEYTPSVGFKMGQISAEFDPSTGQLIGFRSKSEAEIGFGIEKRIGRHVFSLTFSNTQTTTTARYNSSNLGLSPDKFTIGFNLFRRLL